MPAHCPMGELWFHLRKRYYSYLSPEKLCKLLYHQKLGFDPDLTAPQTFNEKVLWLSLFSDTSRWTQLADKYRVRAYVESCGLSELLNDLYGVWNSPQQIDFKALPDQFVLKTNNGCGDICVVKQKQTANLNQIRRHLNGALRKRFGRKTGEHHYLRIKPCVIAEKLLKPVVENRYNWLIDYKFYCFNGTARYCMICYDRGEKRRDVKTALYDVATWEDLTHHVAGDYQDHAQRHFDRPRSFDKMVHAAEILSRDFAEVRVDFYEVDGAPIFGEMTFTSAAGMDTGFTPEFQRTMGDQIRLPLCNKRPQPSFPGALFQLFKRAIRFA